MLRVAGAHGFENKKWYHNEYSNIVSGQMDYKGILCMAAETINMLVGGQNMKVHLSLDGYYVDYSSCVFWHLFPGSAAWWV